MSFIVKTQFDGYSRDGLRSLNKGGGGGGSSGTPYYGNMDRLYGAQSQAAEYMLNNSMPYIPGYMENSSKMVGDAMDGTLSSQMRQQAGNNATATMGAALSANDRNMQRYGMGFSADRLLSEGNKNAIMGAASKAGAMNDAAAKAEDMKWNRNAGALGQATGMGTGAMQSTGSAASGYGAAAGQMQGYDALNSAGYGKFGGAIAANAFKDGGSVGKPGLHLAIGGTANPWTTWQNNNPIKTSAPNNGGGSGLSDAVGSIAMGAAPIIAGKGIKAGLSAIKGAMKSAEPAANTVGTLAERGGGAMANGAEPTAQAATSVAEASKPGLDVVAATAPESAATTAAADTAATAGTDIAATAATDAAAAAATDAATVAAADTAATAGAAAVGEAAAAGSAAGPIGTAAGLVVGGLMASGALDDVFAAKGGAIKRKNMKPGGKVSGKGTATSDDIPAWLSDGEHVQNAESVKLAGLDTLEAINRAGLNVREGKQDPDSAKRAIGEAMIDRGEELTAGLHLAKGGRACRKQDIGLHMACGGKPGVKLAGGGFLGGNLGIALGSGVDEWDKQKKLGMEQSINDLRLALAKPQLATQDAEIANRNATYELDTGAKNNAIALQPGEKSNSLKKQQGQGISLDNTLMGYAGQSLSDGNKERGVQIINESLKSTPGYNGVKVIDVQPASNGSGVNYIMDDNTTKFVSTDELRRAMGSIKQGEYQFIHDGAGNVYSGNKTTGSVSQQVKGDPAQFNKQHAPKEMLLAQDWVKNGYAKDMNDAYNKMSYAKGKSRQDFIMEYVGKQAMPGATQDDVNQLSATAGSLYDSVHGTQPAAATSTVPATATGKSGTNWRDWLSAPQ